MTEPDHNRASASGNAEGQSAANAEARPITYQPATGFPPEGLPTVFADFASNMAPLSATARFYLVRTEPDVSGVNAYKNVPVAQIIMPLEGFAATVVFLNRALEGLVRNGAVRKETVDALTQSVSGKPNE
jgi:hypothetical protein